MGAKAELFTARIKCGDKKLPSLTRNQVWILSKAVAVFCRLWTIFGHNLSIHDVKSVTEGIFPWEGVCEPFGQTISRNTCLYFSRDRVLFIVCGTPERKRWYAKKTGRLTALFVLPFSAVCETGFFGVSFFILKRITHSDIIPAAAWIMSDFCLGGNLWKKLLLR